MSRDLKQITLDDLRMPYEEKVARYGRVRLEEFSDVDVALAHIKERCVDEVQSLDWPDFDPAAGYTALVYIAHLEQHIHKLLGQILAIAEDPSSGMGGLYAAQILNVVPALREA